MASDCRTEPTVHPRTGIQPACADHLTISRERVARLMRKALESPGKDSIAEYHYARGIIEVLGYLIDSDIPTARLTRTLEV